MEVYEPREDSELLKKWVEIHADGSVLDMGTGSGIQALAAVDKADKVLAVDLNEKAVEVVEEKAQEHDNLEVKKSDLFKEIYDKFDTIIFNPPYLPKDEDIEDESIYGGEKGYELIESFLEQAKGHLAEGGKILLLFSSLSGKNKIDEIAEREGYTWQVLDTKKMNFETIYVYKLWQ